MKEMVDDWSLPAGHKLAVTEKTGPEQAVRADFESKDIKKIVDDIRKAQMVCANIDKADVENKRTRLFNYKKQGELLEMLFAKYNAQGQRAGMDGATIDKAYGKKRKELHYTDSTQRNYRALAWMEREHKAIWEGAVQQGKSATALYKVADNLKAGKKAESSNEKSSSRQVYKNDFVVLSVRNLSVEFDNQKFNAALIAWVKNYHFS